MNSSDDCQVDSWFDMWDVCSVLSGTTTTNGTWKKAHQIVKTMFVRSFVWHRRVFCENFHWNQSLEKLSDAMNFPSPFNMFNVCASCMHKSKCINLVLRWNDSINSLGYFFVRVQFQFSDYTRFFETTWQKHNFDIKTRILKQTHEYKPKKIESYPWNKNFHRLVHSLQTNRISMFLFRLICYWMSPKEYWMLMPQNRFIN